MKMLTRIGLFLVCVCVCSAAPSKSSKDAAPGPKVVITGVPEPEQIKFPIAGENLNGYIWKPKGKGPFPAMVWCFGSHSHLMNQGSPSTYYALAKAFLSDNYVLLVPDRRVEEDFADKDADLSKERRYINTVEAINRDVEAAIVWLRQQDFILKNRVSVAGQGTGGIQAFLAAEKDIGLLAAVSFSPGAISWESKIGVKTVCERAVRNAKAPIFLIQPQNDSNLGPSAVLGKILQEHGGLNKSMVYPPYGATIDDGKRFPLEGWEVWGYDVLTFLEAVHNSRNSTK